MRLRLSASALVAAMVVTLLPGCERFTSVQTRMARATASMKSGEYQAALIDLHKVLDAQPGNVDAQLLLVDILATSGESRSALVELDRASAAGAPAASTEARRLNLLLTLGDVESLTKGLDASKTLTPAPRAALEGRLLLLQRRGTDAQTAFDRALGIDPNLKDAAIGRIEAIAAQGRISEANQAADDLLLREPQSGRAWLIKGALAALNGEFAVATDASTKAIEHRADLSREQLLQAHIQRVESQLAVGQLDAARASLASLETAAGNGVIVSLMRSRVALADKDYTTAVNELRKFTQAVPQHLSSRLLLAAALLEQGSTEQAYAEAVRNVAEFSDRDEPRLALAEIQMRMGRPAEAEETLQPLTLKSPANPLATAVLAGIRIRRGDDVAGISLLEQSVVQSPEDSRLRLQLAAAYLSQGDGKRAIETLASIRDSAVAGARDRLHVIATATLQGPAAGERELEAAVTRHPDDIDLLLLAAAYQASLDHLDRARGYLESARKLRPQDAVLALAQGRFELSMDRPDEAESLAKSVLDKSPNEAAAMTLMANVAARRGREADVDTWLSRARLSSPGALDVRMALARRAMARGNTAEAREILTEAARNLPANPISRIALAELDAGTGHATEAMRSLREADKESPNSPTILLTMARVQLATKDVAAARASLKSALKASPGWLPAAATLVSLETAAGDLPAAFAVVNDVRRVDPQGPNSFSLEGEVYLGAKRNAEAVTAFTAAYRRLPGADAARRVALAKTLARMPEPESALQDWLARTPTDALARRSLSEYLMSSGRNDQAVKELETVVTARPGDVAALNNLAWLYHLKKDSRAVTMAERAYTVAPKMAAVADTYGWVLLQDGTVDKGLELLKQAAELAPTDGQIQIHYVRALVATGSKERAIAVLQAAIEHAQFESRKEAEQLLRELQS